jgi:F-type H+-transporting ATPase subunit gamma
VLKAYLRATACRDPRFVAGNASGVERRVCLVVVAGDKGLCGDFNASVTRAAEKLRRDTGGTLASLFLVGRKAVEGLRHMSAPERREYANIFRGLNSEVSGRISREVFEAYIGRQCTELHVVYNRFVSTSRHQTTVTRLLPLDRTAHAGTAAECEPGDLPAGAIVGFWFDARIHALLRESNAAQLAAQMLAMSNATRNAGELIDTLTLQANKARQSAITRELAEIVGTGEVMRE